MTEPWGFLKSVALNNNKTRLVAIGDQFLVQKPFKNMCADWWKAKKDRISLTRAQSIESRDISGRVA